MNQHGISSKDVKKLFFGHTHTNTHQINYSTKTTKVVGNSTLQDNLRNSITAHRSVHRQSA